MIGRSVRRGFLLGVFDRVFLRISSGFPRPIYLSSTPTGGF